MKLTPDMVKSMAAGLKRDHPDLTPEQIAAAIAGVQASTDAQQLRWSMEAREKEREAQKAASSTSVDARPEPIAQDRQAEEERPRDAKF